MKISNFCVSKDTINIVKRQPTEWEKLPANHKPNKRLISSIYREFLKLSNIKTQTIQFKNGERT